MMEQIEPILDRSAGVLVEAYAEVTKAALNAQLDEFNFLTRRLAMSSEETERSFQQLRSLYAISRALSSTLDIQHTLEAIADIEVTHTIKYDNLKNNFTIRRSWQQNEPLVTESFSEAQNLMTEITSLKIIPLSKLEKGQQYQLRTKAEVSKKTLPLNLHYLLFFISLWDFETDWYAIDFIF